MSMLENLPFDEYRKKGGMNQSSLKSIVLESPEKFKYNYGNPKPQTPAMVTGRQVHSYILEPETFFDNYTLDGPINPKTEKLYGSGTKKHTEWLALNPGIEPIDTATINVLEKMKKKVVGNDVAKTILEDDYEKEVSVFWESRGVPQKARIDFCNFDKRKAGDLKTTQCADPKSFVYDIGKFGIDFQAVMTLEGLQIETGEEWNSWTIIAIEKEPPYALEIIPLGESYFARARIMYARAIELYKECLKTGYWPGYTSEIKAAECPKRYELIGEM